MSIGLLWDNRGVSESPPASTSVGAAALESPVAGGPAPTMARIDLRGADLSAARLRSALPRGGVDVEGRRDRRATLGCAAAAGDHVTDAGRAGAGPTRRDFRSEFGDRLAKPFRKRTLTWR